MAIIDDGGDNSDPPRTPPHCNDEDSHFYNVWLIRSQIDVLNRIHYYENAVVEDIVNGQVNVRGFYIVRKAVTATDRKSTHKLIAHVKVSEDDLPCANVVAEPNPGLTFI